MEDEAIKGNNSGEEKTGFSVAAMIFGIISILTLCTIVIPIPCAIIAIILGIIGKGKGGKGMAIAGLVLGSISALIIGIFVALIVLAYSMYGSDIGGFSEFWENTLNEINDAINDITHEDYYRFSGEKIPSLESIMDENFYSYRKANVEVINGKMIVPSILNYFSEPEYSTVNITEVTYENVSDVWETIDKFGEMLHEEYDYLVTHIPTEYTNYGFDYRFCELIKETNSNETYYVAAIYSRDERKIIIQYGIIGTSVSAGGIGPINLEAVKNAR